MLSQRDALARLADGKLQFDPLELTAVDVEPSGFDDGRPDCVLEFRWQDRSERFAAEYRSVGTPKRIREALGRLQRYRTTRLHPMVLAPYFDESKLDRLADQQISGIDFSGNGVVVVPGQWLVYRTGQPNAFPASQYIQEIFRGRSSFVPRLLLLRRSFSQVSEIKREIERRRGTVSLSTVSKVLTRLEEEVLISREDGIRLLQPGQLLDRLRDSYRPPEPRERQTGEVPDLGEAFSGLLELAQDGVRIVGRGEAGYTTFPGSRETVTVFTEDLQRVAAAIEFEEARRFPNVELVETGEETVFFDSRQREQFLWTSPVETYLQLAAGGKREREIAEQLRGDLLAGRYD